MTFLTSRLHNYRWSAVANKKNRDERRREREKERKREREKEREREDSAHTRGSGYLCNYQTLRTPTGHLRQGSLVWKMEERSSPVRDCHVLVCRK